MLRAFTIPVVCLSLLPTAALASAQEVRQTIQIGGAPGGEMPLSMLPPGRSAKTGTSSVRGRVVAGDSGSALRRAQVRISGPDIGSKTALTDAQGRYEFRELPAGRFNISVTKSGFVTMQYGQNRPFEPGRPIELVDAQALDKVDVSLPRGSVLAGRVVDELGEAVAEAEVSAMRMQYQNGKRRLVPSGRTASTNDLGQFRIYGLPPGEYYVSAQLRNAATMMFDMIGGGAPSASNQNTGYASTYYPGTPNPSEAQRVALAVGQELPSVDIQLQPVRLAKISGTAIGSDGKPMSSAMVMLMPSMRDTMQLMPGGSTRTNADGQFTINSVAPGEYSLQVQSGGGAFITTAGGNAMTFAFSMSDRSAGGPQAPQQEREFAVTNVNMAGEDITGMVLVGTRGAKATGTLVFEGGVKPDGVTTTRISAIAADVDASPMPGAGATQVKENGSFEVEGLMGPRLFRVINAPKGWVVKRVLLNGDDITDKGAEFKPGEDVAGLEIELTNRVTTLAGAITDDRGQSQKDSTVVIFPEDQSKWVLPTNRWMTTTRPDQEGRYKITALPPGSYYALAVEYVAPGEWQDPDWLARAAKKATRVTLDEGSSRTLDLKVAGS
jgi:protocatechuate 3,4-dioxygenase beta subunit